MITKCGVIVDERLECYLNDIRQSYLIIGMRSLVSDKDGDIATVAFLFLKNICVII